MRENITREELYALIEAYRNGACTRAETERLFRWLDSLEKGIAEPGAEDWQALRARIKEEVWTAQEKLIAATVPSKRFTLLHLWKYAAMLTAASLLIYFLNTIRTGKQGSGDQSVNVQAMFPAVSERDSAIVNYSALPVRHILADGSVVTLSPKSVLQLHLPWGKKERAIMLNGQAKFEVVKKDTAHRFIVYTKQFHATVLGTVFIISAYDSLPAAHVQLLSGKIAVQRAEDKRNVYYLSPGDECNFNAATNTLVLKRPVNGKLKTLDNDSASFIEVDGGIAFNNTSIASVLKALGKVYQQEIIVTASAKLDKRKFTGTIKTNKPLEEVLSTLAGLNELLVEKKESAYIIKTK